MEADTDGTKIRIGAEQKNAGTINQNFTYLFVILNPSFAHSMREY
jgi:hypothetical protein